MSPGLRSILRRRLVLIGGKGGTGKTSLTAALAWLAREGGRRVVVAELSHETVLPRLLCETPPADAGAPRRQPQKLAPGMYHLRISPTEQLEEYLETQIRVRALVRVITRNAGFRRLLDAAPGWRDLIALGKLWHLTTLHDSGGPAWPLLIVDAPATGHGLSLLSVPGAALDAIRGGPLRRHTAQVQSLLTDPARTLVLPVALAEELPVREVAELRARVDELGIRTGPTLANALEPPLDPAVEAAIAGLEPAHRDAPALVEPRALRELASRQGARARLQAGFVERLVEDSGPVLSLPYLVDSIDGPQGTAALADALRGALAGHGEIP